MPLHDIALRVPATCRPDGRERREEQLTETLEEYTEGIYRLQEELETVGTGDIAKYMGVSSASVTAVLKRLVNLGLVEHAPYKGVRVTSRGEAVSVELLRKHRLLECLLVDVVGLPWAGVHDLACKLEHYVSSDVADHIASALSFPVSCPHGSPIDASRRDSAVRLSSVNEGVSGVVARVTDEREEFLAHVEALGLIPGARFVVTSRSPLGDVLEVTVDGRGTPEPLGTESAASIWVTPAPVRRQSRTASSAARSRTARARAVVRA